MATKINALLATKDGSMDNFKVEFKVKEQVPDGNESVNELRKQPKKQRKSKQKSDKISGRKQEDQCLDSSSTLGIGGEVYGHPIPELYPELSEEPLDLEENNNQQESQTVPGLHVKEQLNESQASSEDSQPIGIKKRRKMCIPRKIEVRNEGYHSDDVEDNGQIKQRTGSWVQCTLPQCGKWRFLNDKVDPNDLPDRWVCSMNSDTNFNRCGTSQEDFDSQDEDFDVVYSPYPEGAVVWAKLAGYPWWPGMMENDPDYGYYCETEENSRVPISYHVVFFDKDVSRAWVNTYNVRLFHADDNPEDQGNVIIRKKNFKKKLDLAANQARQALSISPKSRLKAYSFEKRFKGPIGYRTNPSKNKKTKTKEGKEEKADSEEKEERDEEEEDIYVNSVESSEFSESSENFSSEEFCKMTKKKTPSKKINNKKPSNNMATKKRPKKEIGKDKKNESNTRNTDIATVKTSCKPIKNTKPRKKSMDMTDTAAKTFLEMQEDKIKEDKATTISTNAVTKDSGAIAPSQEIEMFGQVQCDLKKEPSVMKENKSRKRKIVDKKKDEEDKKKDEEEDKKEKTMKIEPQKIDKEKESSNTYTSVDPIAITQVQSGKTPNKRLINKYELNGKTKNTAECSEKPHVGVDKTEEKQSEYQLEEKSATEAISSETLTLSSSLKFANMPKLVKASFRPPSKKGLESSNSCPNANKMPKLWKPRFVCPAVAAEKATALLNGKKMDQNVQCDKKDGKEVEIGIKKLKGSICNGKDRCSITNKTPLLQATNPDPSLSDEVEEELAMLDRNIEDMMKKFKDFANQNEKKDLPRNDNVHSTEDSPEF